MIMQSFIPEILSGNFLIRLAVAAILGSFIGLERDIHGREAGLRTNILISLGAAVFMILSEGLASVYGSGPAGEDIYRVDPARIAAQVVTGIGFLGAGSIIKTGLTIRGLTTAACIWMSAGIGMSAGAGFFELAGAATVLSLFSLIFLSKLEKKYSRDTYRTLEIIAAGSVDVSRLIKIIKHKDIKILYFDQKKNYAKNEIFIRLVMRMHHRGSTDKLAHSLLKDIESAELPLKEVHWFHR
ncbi:MAG: MgtC/SapB family protein [Spirochaetales bacterium]|nr:MgtC/SapB family protein [Spirochaetales bacterium]